MMYKRSAWQSLVLVNFAEEVNKVLKTFEDLTTSGKHAHALQTAEAGVTRLVRTASKAFHNRGCDLNLVLRMCFHRTFKMRVVCQTK